MWPKYDKAYKTSGDILDDVFEENYYEIFKDRALTTNKIIYA